MKTNRHLCSHLEQIQTKSFAIRYFSSILKDLFGILKIVYYYQSADEILVSEYCFPEEAVVVRNS